MALTNHVADAHLLSIKWPKLDDLDPAAVTLAYDEPSDTLYVQFYGDARPGYSDSLDVDEYGDFMVRVDPTTGEGHGLQFEYLLHRVVKRHPELLDCLDVADLWGITRGEVAAIRRQIPAADWKRSLVASLFRDLADHPVNGAG